MHYFIPIFALIWFLYLIVVLILSGLYAFAKWRLLRWLDTHKPISKFYGWFYTEYDNITWRLTQGGIVLTLLAALVTYLHATYW